MGFNSSSGTTLNLNDSTLREPDIVNSIDDVNDNPIIKLVPDTTPVNEISVGNGDTAVAPTIAATGTDTNIDLALAGKGSGAITLTSPKVTTGINDTNGLELIKFTATGSAVNELTVTNQATGSSPSLAATGDDANIDIVLTAKGTGAITATSPKITTGINDANGLESILLTATGSAVNEVTVANAATAGSPTISATGDDTDIDLTLAGKGTGAVALTSPNVTTGINDANGLESILLTPTGSAVNEITVANAATAGSPTISATGDDTDIDLTLAGKGTGAVATTSPKITTSINDANGLELLNLTATGSAVNEMTLANAATGADPSLTASGETNVGIDLISKGTGFVSLVADDTDAVSVQKDTNVKIGFFGVTPVVKAVHIADPAAQAAITATLTGVDTGTDMTAAQAATIVADLTAGKAAADANKASIDAILVVIENIGLNATS